MIPFLSNYLTQRNEVVRNSNVSLIRYAQNVNQHIGALGSKVEEQLKEINEKCSELQRQENRVRKCLKKLSAASTSKKETDNESQRTASSNEKERRLHENNALNNINTAGDDDVKNIDYNRIIRNAMKSSDSNSLNQNTKKSSKSMILIFQ